MLASQHCKTHMYNSYYLCVCVQTDLKTLGIKPSSPLDYNVHQLPPPEKEGGKMVDNFLLCLSGSKFKLLLWLEDVMVEQCLLVGWLQMLL